MNGRRDFLGFAMVAAAGTLLPSVAEAEAGQRIWPISLFPPGQHPRFDLSDGPDMPTDQDRGTTFAAAVLAGDQVANRLLTILRMLPSDDALFVVQHIQPA